RHQPHRLRSGAELVTSETVAASASSTARPSEATETIAGLDVADVRFPTSRHRDGSDAMNPFPDYSAAYVVLRTSTGECGYALVFTVGRGNDVQAAAIRALEPLVVGLPVQDVIADTQALSRRL